jgi:hypothetical protein
MTMQTNKPNMKHAMQEFINQQQLLDLWTETNPDQFGYTRVTESMKSRLDCIYIQEEVTNNPTMII